MAQFQVIDGESWTGMGLCTRPGDLPLIQLEIIKTQLVDRAVGRIERSFCPDKSGGVVSGPDIASRTGHRTRAGERRGRRRSRVDKDIQSVLVCRRAGIE